MSDSSKGPRPRGMLKLTPQLIVLIVVVVAVLGTLLTSFFIVDQTETGVVLRLGRFSREVPAGLHWKWPLGLEESMVVPTEQRLKMEFGYQTIGAAGTSSLYSPDDFSEVSTMLTGDRNIADVEWEIQFEITDARAWLFEFEDPNQTIWDVSRSVVNRLVGDRALIDVLSNRTEIENQGLLLMNEYFTALNLGITVITVKMQNILPPSGPVQAAFQDVNAAQQDAERLINEGREAINREIPRARGEAEQIVEIARGYAAERVNRARGDVARFSAVLSEYVRNPGTTRSRLYYEAMEEVFGDESSLTLIDRDLQNFLPILNLNGGVQQ